MRKEQLRETFGPSQSAETLQVRRVSENVQCQARPEPARNAPPLAGATPRLPHLQQGFRRQSVPQEAHHLPRQQPLLHVRTVRQTIQQCPRPAEALQNPQSGEAVYV